MVQLHCLMKDATLPVECRTKGTSHRLLQNLWKNLGKYMARRLKKKCIMEKKKNSPRSSLPKYRRRRCCCKQRWAGQEKWGLRGGPKLQPGTKSSSMLLLWAGSGLTVMAPVFTKGCVRLRRHLRPFLFFEYQFYAEAIQTWGT